MSRRVKQLDLGTTCVVEEGAYRLVTHSRPEGHKVSRAIIKQRR
jgi:hypothetical protein